MDTACPIRSLFFLSVSFCPCFEDYYKLVYTCIKNIPHSLSKCLNMKQTRVPRCSDNIMNIIEVSEKKLFNRSGFVKSKSQYNMILFLET